MEFVSKSRYDVKDLIDIVKLLRSPNGCPWDIKQTHKSIRSNFLEEAYEAIEAIDNDDVDLLREELGDVLLQVVFHSQMEDEIGNFNFDDVANDICQKLVARHPHVFSNVVANNEQEALASWNKAKMELKSQKNQSDAMISISKVLPSLMKSDKILSKASQAGFDWDNVEGALSKLKEELLELEEAIHSGDKSHCNEELGDVLFSIVNVSRFLEIDPEYSLSKACNKFIKRFCNVEKLAKSKGINLKDLTQNELVTIWKQAKKM